MISHQMLDAPTSDIDNNDIDALKQSLPINILGEQGHFKFLIPFKNHSRNPPD